MHRYQKKFHQEWMSSDIKPSHKIRASIENSNKQYGKQEIQSQLEDASAPPDDWMHPEDLHEQELFMAWYWWVDGFGAKLDLL